MPKPKRSSVQKYHDRVAPIYDHSYENVFWQWHDRLTWDYIKPHLPTDLRSQVIDLGCGTGKWSAKLLKSGYTVTCVDISVRMLDQARLKIDNQSDLKRSTFLHADIADLSSLPADHFALALAMGDPIGCTDSPSKTMQQIRRILKPDGLLIATLDNRYAALDYYLERGQFEEMSRFLKNGRTHWLTKNPNEQFSIHTFSPQNVLQLVESCGFQMVELIGKTVLPMRHYRELLETPEDRRRWAKIEKKLARQSDALSRASHLQLTARKIRDHSSER